MTERATASAAPSTLVVAIDGPSGVGKSTVAGRLAKRLGVPVLDTGAMYRAVALKVLGEGVDFADCEAIVGVALTADLDLRWTGEGAVEVLLDGEAVGQRIRTPAVSAATSKISVHPEIRHRLVELQQRCAARYGAVVEGRDIGTVVFPLTPHKFFLTARPEVRAERRYAELAPTGKAASFATVLRDIEERDARDSGRKASPLVCDDTYVAIDTSDLTIDEIVERMVDSVRARRTELDRQAKRQRTGDD